MKINIGGIEYTLDVANKTAEIFAYSNPTRTSELIIPSQVYHDGNFFSVISIQEQAFYEKTSIKSVIISNGILQIGEGAFYGCSSLESIYIPQSITSIEKGCLGNCTELSCIVVDSNNKVFDSRNNCNAIIKTADNTLVVGCKKSVIPYGVENIADNAFIDCENLKNIAIPYTIKNIGKFAFSGCLSLTSIIIPEGINVIKEGTFSYCTSLVSILLPNTIIEIDDHAFEACSSLNFIIIPENVERIQYDAFEDCTSLETIVWNVKQYNHESPFENIQTQIKSFIFGNNVKSIPEGICSHMTNLRYIKLPDTLQEIEAMAFEHCSSLESIDIPKSTIHIGGDAFSNCKSLKHIKLPDAIQEIGAWAFDNCLSLESIDIPKSTTSIGSHAFSDCKSLKYIKLPHTLQEIEDCAFFNCQSLTSIELPNNIVHIGENAFSCCESITTINWNVKTCNDFTEDTTPFDNCPSINSFNFGDCVEDIPSYLCFGLNISALSLPNNIKSIGRYAFANCTKLTDIVIPYGVENIRFYAFHHCDSLRSILLPSTLIKIGFNIFEESYNLQIIKVPLGKKNKYCELGLDNYRELIMEYSQVESAYILNLAIGYEYGIGVERDIQKAIHYYQEAENKGSIEAIQHLKRIQLLQQ